MQANTKKILILLGVIAIIAIIIIVAISQSKKFVGEKKIDTQTQNQAGSNPVEGKLAPEEVAPSKTIIDSKIITPEAVKESVSVVSGTSLITKDNKVITPEGTPVKLNVMPSSAEAPKESAPIKGAQIPTGVNVVKLSVSAAGFSPNTFTVKEGQLVNFVLTSTDDFTHVWLPDDLSLIATALGVAGKETRVKSWNAPKKGTYTFRCDIPGHAGRGETGKMIVE